MTKHWPKILMVVCGVWALACPDRSLAQLDRQFSFLFDTILKERMILSPGAHRNHYIDAAAEAESLLTPALNSLIAGNISSFPLSSTTPSISFDFAGGELVSVTEGLGPIFSDRATTTGSGRLNVGFNATFLDLSRLRGIETERMQFAFTHKDLDNDQVLGGIDSTSTEGDVITVTLGSTIRANIYAFFATYGITRNLDIAVAVPVIHVSMRGSARAVLSSFTFANTGTALHFFGGTSISPVLETVVPYSEEATGLGDVAVRLKYCFVRGASIDAGALVDVRLPSGKPEKFMGSGKTNVTVSALLSKKLGDFSPHLNVGYEFRSADLESDRIILKGGFDQKLTGGLSFAVDFLGLIDVQKNEAIKLFPGTRSLTQFSGVTTFAVHTVDLSNIPDRDNDNLYNLSAGFRFSPFSQLLLLANVLVPLNNGGLRAPVAPTIGLSMNL